MPTAEARVPTRRADRYLSQLCDHLTHLRHGPTGHDPAGAHAGGHASAAVVRGVDRAGGHAEIEFDWGRCALTATQDELVVRLQAADPAALARGQELLELRIETIGRRDQLEISWQPLD